MPESLLLVEDEPVIADGIRYTPERLPDDRVDCIVSGGSGSLPDRNGFDLRKEIQTWSPVPAERRP